MEPRTYHVAPSIYATFATLTATLLVLWASIVWNAGAPWEPLALPPIAFAVFVLWVSRFSVTFGAHEIVVSTPTSGVRRLAVADILSVELAEPRPGSGTPETLSIRTSYGDELRLDARFFASEVVHRLLALGPVRGSVAPRAKRR